MTESKKNNQKSDGLTNKVLRIIQMVSEKKAINPIGIRVTEECNFCHYFIVCSSDSATHTRAIYNYIIDKCKEEGIEISNKGIDIDGTWGVVDFFDIIFHVFQEPMRLFYDIEGLWNADPANIVKLPNNE